MSGAASAGVFSGGWVWVFLWRWAAAPRRGLCPDVPRLSVPRRINRVAPLGAAIAVDGQKKGRDEKMTAPPPRPSPKGAGVRGKAALRVSTLQAFPRLPRLGQSPRVTSNSVLSGCGKPLCDYVKSTPPVYMPPGFREDRKLVLDGKPGGFVLNRVVRAEILKTLNQRAPIAFKNANLRR